MCYFWGKTGAYSGSEQHNKPKVLELEIALRVIDEMANAKPKPYYSFFGGEPFTYPHLEEVIRAIKGNGARLDSPTNGTLLAKYAEMIVETGFDQLRVSIDGPQDINDLQRGNGSYAKAVEGIIAVHEAKLKAKSKSPLIAIMPTLTPDNYQCIENFLLHNKDFDVSMIDHVEIQMENFITYAMGDEYANLLKNEFGIKSDRYWKSLVRPIKYFEKVDVEKLARQVNKICEEFTSRGITYFLSPPTFIPDNIANFLKADWKNMTDQYESCSAPWINTNIIASGEVSACHIFYDLIMGDLHSNTFKEIWEGEKYLKFREYMRQNKFMSICNIGCCVLYIMGNKKSRKQESHV
jgi:radical SAM protein with 4Fe4S-binding SPASM domain